MTELDGLLLVSSSSSSVSSSKSSLSTTINEDNNIVRNVWRTMVPLSFWGGIDPISGIVIDETHPWMGRCVSGAIIILPSGRGSCTASQVLWELIRNHVAPRAIVLRDLDGQMCIGAIVAQQLLSTIEIQQEQQYPSKETKKDCHWIPDILHLGVDAFETCMNLPDEDIQYGIVTSSGKLLLGNSQSQVTEQLQALNQNSENKEQNTIHQKHAHFSSLTDEENAMLDAAATNAERMALEVLIRYAHIVSYPHTPTYVPIQAAHIDACTYIGPGGLEFATRLVQAGGQVKVPTTLNAGSCDRHRWKALGVPENYAQPSLALGDAYVALGCQPTFTCAPYLLLQNQQQQQQHPYTNQDLGWGESNAVVYANSVWGARTEKYADYLDICVALVGKTVQIGVHVAENRRPQILLDATNVLKDISTQSPSMQDIDSLFPILGHLCGTLSDGLVPMLLGLETWTHVITTDHLKAFCAAFGTTGTSPLIHIAGITPEARDISMFAQQQQQLHQSMDPRRIEITWEDVKKTYTTLDSSSSSSSQSEIIDLVALGNPHLSIPECHLLSQLVQGSRKHDSVRVFACMSRSLYEQIQTSDDSITKNLEQFGVEFIHDTCWCMLLDPPVLPPLSQTSKKRNSTILTNSGKYAHYGPGLTQRQYRFGSWNNCIEAAITGKYLPLQQPSWLLRPSSSKRQFVSWTQTSLRQIIRRMRR
jgi:cis-L-3-hydroxyproline dehydratase